MNWNNLKLGKKFSLAFGIIIVLMVVSGYWAINGIGDIVFDAGEVIDGNKLRTELEDKYVDHLLWAQNLNKLLTDETVTTLNVETDHHKCAFGKWYYGEGRSHAEKLVPELAEVFEEFEKPHEHLHHSAIKISEVFEQLDWRVAVKLKQAEIDHIKWLAKVKDAIYVNNSRTIDVIKDPTQCNFGKWLASDEMTELKHQHSETKEIIDKISLHHDKLHQSVVIAEQFQRNGQTKQAMDYFSNEIVSNTNQVLNELNSFSNWFENDLMGMTEANHIYQSETMKHLSTMGRLFEEAVHSSEDYILTDEIMLNEATNTRVGVIMFVIMAVAIAIILALFITRSLINPINKSLKFANKVATGDLTATIDVEQKDEIGELALSLKQMVRRLKDIVSNIKSGSDNIASASQQLSSGAQQISSGVSEQAASAEEVSSSMEEMAANIQQNTENAVKTMDISSKSSNSVEQVAMASEQSMNAVRDIFSKINVVVEIAEKTDLLAINAAVEAARAGDQGRGFAVVAAEVRKLAERSQLAASEIVALADKGLKMTEGSNDLLKSIVPDIQETSRLVEEIASASREQESGVSQVNMAVQQLSMVTQQNASSSEEMAGSSEEMAQQASDLERVTQFFRVDNESFTQSKPSVVVSNMENPPKSNGNGNGKMNLKKNQLQFELGNFESDSSGYEPM
ncbi:HAMP domain-containing protein [Labilibacter sediminis]|nr:HAMP domain-containing protein [Labilibacter sediminis]